MTLLERDVWVLEVVVALAALQGEEAAWALVVVVLALVASVVVSVMVLPVVVSVVVQVVDLEAVVAKVAAVVAWHKWW